MLNEFNKLIYFRFEQMDTTIKEQTSTMLNTMNEHLNSLQGQSDSSDREATPWWNNQLLPDQGCGDTGRYDEEAGECNAVCD
ncbi:hypothetical protein Bpfe_029981 [Biomphalaria pfeifferi]|uniref:Uncharacterized protein n=1 Tax=Biomphalaria pfeifferi TaxID=112525 RepID=A0AAD8ARM4_BIOPF|nr:hypothetical protein Bpfe_029981 [Biomphalaria pfeifferi]